MAVFTYYADMGSIRIASDTHACFFNNGFGDGTHKVHINPKKNFNRDESFEFEGHFEVLKDNTTHLMDADCEPCVPLYTFKAGRYPVYSKNYVLYIGKWE